MTAATQALEPHHLVRLTTYRPTTELDETAFIRAWQEAAQTAQPEGLVYRELCRQVPEWSQKAAAEMDNPISYPFLEYAVLEPDQNPVALPPLPAAFANDLEAKEALYYVEFRLVADAPRTPECVMFNLFELSGPAGMQQDFVMDWPARGAFKAREKGFFASVLHKIEMTGSAPLTAFNRAEWQSADIYAEGIERFEKAFPSAERKVPDGEPSGPPPVKSYLGLFKVVASVQALSQTRSTTKPMMTAVRIHNYGGPDVLRVEEVPRPEPGPGEILLRVHAVAVNPLDIKMRAGEVQEIYPSWFPDILGYSVAGVVEAVGRNVVERQVGEEVYGLNDPIMRRGYAQFLTGPEGFYYPKPSNLDWAAAAAAPSIFATAHGALFGRAGLQSGQRILIHGGSGVVGSCAVQLAKRAGAYVITTASAQNIDAVKALGADEVIDYRRHKFEEMVQNVDFVLDTQGGETRERSWALLNKGGVLATLLPPVPDEAKARGFGVHALMVHGHPNVGEIMPEMTQLLEEGRLQPPHVAETFLLHQAARAHASYEAKPPRGRIVLAVHD